MIYYKLGQKTINVPGLAGVCILPNSIVSDQDSVSTSKFWFLQYYFELNCGYHPHVFYENSE